MVSNFNDVSDTMSAFRKNKTKSEKANLLHALKLNPDYLNDQNPKQINSSYKLEIICLLVM